MPKGDDQQRNAKRKRELLQKAAKRKKTKETKAKNKKISVTKVPTNDIKKLQHQLSAYKKELSSAQSQNDKLRQKCKEIKQENYDLKLENKKLRSNTTQTKQENELLKEEYQKQIDDLNAKISEKLELEKWFIKQNISTTNDLKEYIDNITYRYDLVSLLFQVESEKYQDVLANLTGQVKGNSKLQKKLEKQNRQINEFNRVKQGIYNKLAAQKKKNQEIKKQYEQRISLQNATPENLINLLTNRCSVKNFSYYDNLYVLVRKYEKVLDELLHEKQPDDHRYGYIQFARDGYYLHDVNSGEVVHVGVNPHVLTHPNFTDGSAVRCRKNNSNWEIEKFYYLPSKSTRSVKPKHKQKKKAEHVHNDREIVISNLDELSWAMQKKILVVGNKFLSGFLDELKKYCQLQVMDAYEDGMQRIFEAMHKSDYVFLLLGSVPHALTDYTKNTTDLNKDSQKVQIFDAPAKYDGVIRLHYLFVNS